MNKKKTLTYCYDRLFLGLILIATLFIGIGYAAINSVALDISGTAIAQKYEGLFIAEVEFEEAKNENVEKMDNISTFETILNSKVTLSSGDTQSYISYLVTVYNNTDDIYYYTGTVFDESFYDNEDIIYTVYNLNENNLLESNKKMVFEVVFEYKDSILSSNNVLNSYIKFCFSKAYVITYTNIAGDNLPKYAIENEDLSITFNNNIPADVKIYIDDVSTNNYTYIDDTLTIPNVEGKIEIAAYIPEPNLSNDLIPVMYDGNNWIAVDENSDWYDYSKQEWANAVIPKENVSIYTGDSVDLENDILGIFVWIPRYEYKLSNNDTNEVYINFISSNKTTPTTGYTLPDAFSFGTDELDGVWIGKFETSMDSTENQLYVIPNAVATTEQSVNTQYNLARAFNESFNSTNIDSHMSKSSEWAVAAYLSQSLYGKFGNENYTGENKEIYANDSLLLYTGRSAGTPSSTGTSNGTYNYDDGFSAGTEESGIGASTTGNIYGIYDMNGGAYEYVMGYLTSANSTFGATNSGWNPSEFSSTPNSKYYDGYATAPSSSRPYISHALGETAGWYDDANTGVTSSIPWYIRGGVADAGKSSEIFAYEIADGGPGSYATFRITLSITND